MTDIEKIMNAVRKPVTFKYPGNEGQKKGILRERAVVPSDPGSTGVPYWDVVDLIEFPGEKEAEWMRIGYYRKPKDRLVWGSQTTITEPITVWKRLLVDAAKQKKWLRDILEDVVRQLKQ